MSDPKAIALLYEHVTREFPALNMLINNAGIMRKINLQDKGGDLEDISREIETNLMGPVRMVKQFLPQLKAQPSAAIVNVSLGLAFHPVSSFTHLLCCEGGRPFLHPISEGSDQEHER